MTDELTLRLVEERRNAARWLAYVGKGPRVPTLRETYDHIKLCCRLRLPPGVVVSDECAHRDMARRTVTLQAWCANGVRVEDQVAWDVIQPGSIRTVGMALVKCVAALNRANRVAQRAGVEVQPCKINMPHDDDPQL